MCESWLSSSWQVAFQPVSLPLCSSDINKRNEEDPQDEKEAWKVEQVRLFFTEDERSDFSPSHQIDIPNGLFCRLLEALWGNDDNAVIMNRFISLIVIL